MEVTDSGKKKNKLQVNTYINLIMLPVEVYFILIGLSSFRFPPTLFVLFFIFVNLSTGTKYNAD
jgi:hypothetical protein